MWIWNFLFCKLRCCTCVAGATIYYATHSPGAVSCIRFSGHGAVKLGPACNLFIHSEKESFRPRIVEDLFIPEK
jgi:hypothetical protein